MSDPILITELTTRYSSEGPLGQLHGALQDLLLIHHQSGYSEPELLSTYLHGSRYVSGEKSAERSCMRYIVSVSPTEEAGHAAEETFTLELSVRRTRTC